MTKKHILIMAACCLAPAAVAAVVLSFNLQGGVLLSAGIALLCPAAHLLMMRFMHGHSGEHAPAASQQPAHKQAR